MNLSRQEFMEQGWIDAEERLPNPAVHKHILTYNSHSGSYSTPFSFVVKDIVKYMHDFWSGKVTRPRDGTGTYICGLEITHWMPIYPPKEEFND